MELGEFVDRKIGVPVDLRTRARENDESDPEDEERVSK